MSNEDLALREILLPVPINAGGEEDGAGGSDAVTSLPTAPEQTTCSTAKEWGGVRLYWTDLRHAYRVQLFLWMLKDFAWMRGWRLARFASAATILWSVKLQLLSNKTWTDLIHNLGMLGWLLGNFVWMYIEVNVIVHGQFFEDEGDDDSDHMHRIYVVVSLFLIGLLVLLSHYVLCKPRGWIPPLTVDGEAEREADVTVWGSFPRYFDSYKEYGNMHTLFWCTKDLCWVLIAECRVRTFFIPMWYISSIMTVLLALDFLRRSRTAPAEFAISGCTLFWALSMIVWSYGEIYWAPSMDPFARMASWPADQNNLRWYSSWLVASGVLLSPIMYGCAWCVRGRGDGCTARSGNRQPTDIIARDANATVDGTNQDDSDEQQQRHVPDENKQGEDVEDERVLSNQAHYRTNLVFENITIDVLQATSTAIN